LCRYTEGVEDNGNFTRVAAFPIGIDPGRFTQAGRCTAGE
jgi:trehalose-6-phosphate synthase